jgi:hypothetical protein
VSELAIADRQKDKDALAAFLSGVETYLVMHPAVYAEFLKAATDVTERIKLEALLEFGCLARFGDMPVVVSNQSDDRESAYEVRVAPATPTTNRLNLSLLAGKVLGVRKTSFDAICQRLLIQPSKKSGGTA